MGIVIHILLLSFNLFKLNFLKIIRMVTLLHLTDDEKLSREEELKKKLIAKALEKKIATRATDLAVRDILPDVDLGYSAKKWETGTLPAFTFSTVVNKRLEDTKVIGFVGVRDLKGGIGTGITSVIRFKVGPGAAKVRRVFQIQGIESEEEKEGYFEEDIIYENGQHVGIDFYNVADGVSNLQLIGFVVEPKGELVAQG